MQLHCRCVHVTIPVSARSLSPALQDFIAHYVRSVEQVEILCLFSAEPGRIWMPGDVLRVIQSSEKSVTTALEYFRAIGLLQKEPGDGYRFAPEKPERTELVAELATAYRQRRLAVIESIHGRPSDAIKDFANAFKLRKQK
jgi:hypothetical protein